MDNPRQDTAERRRIEAVEAADPARPQVVVLEPRRGALDAVVKVLAGLAMVVIILMLASLLLVIVGLSSSLGAANTSLSSASSAIQQASAAIQGPIQGLIGQIQPDRPPPAAISAGPEFADLRRAAVGDQVGQSSRYIVTVSRVVKRDGTADPNQAQYAVVHRKLTTPAPRMVGPVQVGVDYDEADLFLYKGETFQIGADIYQVNWISVEDNAMGVVRFRHPDSVTGTLKFQIP